MRRIITLLFIGCTAMLCSISAAGNDENSWLVRTELSAPTQKQKSFGIAAFYLDLQQPNVVLSILRINENSVLKAQQDLTNLRFFTSQKKPIILNLSGFSENELVYVNLPAGLYQISQIDVPHFDLPYKLSLDNSDVWRFRVTQSQVNYAGTLVVKAQRSINAVDTLLLNEYAQRKNDLQARIDQSQINLALGHGAGYEDPFADFLEGIGNE